MKDASAVFCFEQTDCSVAPRSKEFTVKCNPCAIFFLTSSLEFGGLLSLGGWFGQKLGKFQLFSAAQFALNAGLTQLSVGCPITGLHLPPLGYFGGKA